MMMMMMMMMMMIVKVRMMLLRRMVPIAMGDDDCDGNDTGDDHDDQKHGDGFPW